MGAIIATHKEALDISRADNRKIQTDLAAMAEWSDGLGRGAVTVGGVEFNQRDTDVWFGNSNDSQLLVLCENRREPRFYWEVADTRFEGHEPTLRAAMIAAVEAVKE